MATHPWTPARSIPATKPDDHLLDQQLAEVTTRHDVLPRGAPGEPGLRQQRNYLESRIRQRDMDNERRRELDELAATGDPEQLADAVINHIRGTV